MLTPMGFLENLKTLAEVRFHLKLDLLKNIVIGKKSDVHVTVNITGDVNAKPMMIDEKTINIGLRNLPPKEAEEIQDLLRDALEKEGIHFIEKKAEATIEDIIQNEHADENKKILETLLPYIPSKDVGILRASLYLRKIFKNEGEGRHTGHWKSQIMLKYGDRGRKIANLCTAGYFEEQIIPLLEQMRKGPKFVLEDFQKVYDTIIEEHGFAVFVVSTWEEPQIRAAIKKKIETNLRYGLKYIHIHVIGRPALKKTQAAVTDLLKVFKKLVLETEKVSGNVLYMKLIFESSISDDLKEGEPEQLDPQ
jgi:DNA-binding protein YbaB